ncbi:hypothetical protein O3G_MSEX011384 [Manduca sexta]|uniref:E3 ubiquitin-protein ligase n=2 Tax=Manduca sexta TaxID=7130 RepID=A0A921ZL46_MANSE|nr:hypothetical protein O3G_MSEX011384 [Manduca sexta]KAG6459474.1 hypothetical protein O3G_MSEX011384 [Manduca sexta]KAG6459475.1 hypothetical protein O3G_MSEX011384 [Manduca sexta]
MCRAEIPVDYLDNPVLLEDVSSAQSNDDDSNQKYQWYYEGRNGWWKYDERSNNELELAFSAGESSCTLLLAGALYIVDFQALTQVRRSDQTRKRRVKRDTTKFPAKGIAGIKTEKRQVLDPKNDDENSNTNNACDTANIRTNEENLSSTLQVEVISENERVNYVVDMLGVIHLDDDDDSTSDETENI